MGEQLVTWASGAGAFGGVVLSIYLLAPKVTRWLEIIAEDRRSAREAVAAPMAALAESHERERAQWDAQLRGIVRRLEETEKRERDCERRCAALEERLAAVERRV